MHIVGLITCERDRTRQGCQGPHLRECAEYLSPTSWKKKVQENEKEDGREDGQQEE